MKTFKQFVIDVYNNNIVLLNESCIAMEINWSTFATWKKPQSLNPNL